mgnify:CR=1 FL=1
MNSMEVEVYYGGQRGGAIPYADLPAFRLFCKQSGYQTKWDPKTKRLDLNPGLTGKICVLAPAGLPEGNADAQEIVRHVYAFLHGTGVDAVLVGKKAEVPKKWDVAIRLSVKELHSAAKPRLEIFHGDDERRKRLASILQTELKHTGIQCGIKAPKEARKIHPFLVVQLVVPKETELSQKKGYGEKLAFYLASGILRYFQEIQHISPVSYLSPHILEPFFHTLLLDRTEGMRSSGKSERTEAERHMETTIILPQQTKPEPTATEQATETETATSPGQSVQDEELPAPMAEDKRVHAEVFFDYTLFHSDLENRPFLLIGNLYVKNTGNEALYNPIVCLRVTPIDSVNLGGQILPPRLVETMAVQSATGVKGWRYLEDDWFSQAKERGEYWIAPIQPIQIAPGATESFQNFQLSIRKPEEGNSVTVEGVVWFREQEIHFPANNRIALSF